MSDTFDYSKSRAYRMRADHDAGLHVEHPKHACDECFDQLDQKTNSPERARFNRAFFPNAN